MNLDEDTCPATTVAHTAVPLETMIQADHSLVRSDPTCRAARVPDMEPDEEGPKKKKRKKPKREEESEKEEDEDGMVEELNQDALAGAVHNLFTDGKNG